VTLTDLPSGPTAGQPRADIPAVVFDAAAFRTWCDEPDRNNARSTNAETAGITGTYNSLDPDDGAGSLVERALFALRNAPQVWRTAPDVEIVNVWCTADAEGVDGGALVTVKVDDDVELSAGHFQAGDLVSGESDRTGAVRKPATDAIAEALAHVAEAVNGAVTRFRRVTATPARSVIPAVMVQLHPIWLALLLRAVRHYDQHVADRTLAARRAGQISRVEAAAARADVQLAAAPLEQAARAALAAHPTWSRWLGDPGAAGSAAS